MSALAKIQSAQATGGGNNIRDGRYKYLIEAFTYAKGFQGERVVAELRVIESAPAIDVTGPDGKPVTPNAVQSSCSMVCLLDQHESAAGNAKAFLLAALAPLGFDESDITEDKILNEYSHVSNPLRGIAIANETVRRFNKGRKNEANKGKPLTLNSWKPIEQTPEDILRQRAWLDSNGAKAEFAAPTPAAAPVVEQVAPPVVAQPAPVATAPAASPASTGLLARLGLGK